jgi:hypothetical protein
MEYIILQPDAESRIGAIDDDLLLAGHPAVKTAEEGDELRSAPRTLKQTFIGVMLLLILLLVPLHAIANTLRVQATTRLLAAWP